MTQKVLLILSIESYNISRDSIIVPKVLGKVHISPGMSRMEALYFNQIRPYYKKPTLKLWDPKGAVLNQIYKSSTPPGVSVCSDTLAESKPGPSPTFPCLQRQTRSSRGEVKPAFLIPHLLGTGSASKRAPTLVGNVILERLRLFSS